MNKAGRATDFFIAANGPMGFVSYFEELCQEEALEHLLILKAGPGCGKSTLMKRMAALREGEEEVQRLHCSADPESLDGVLFSGSRLAIVDGTAPHVIEPTFPGAFERVVDLYHCLDEEKLKTHRAEIVEAHRNNKALLARCRSLIGGAGALVGEIYQIAAPCTDREKILRYTASLSKRLAASKKEGRGRESRRFLTCLGAGDQASFPANIPTLCSQTVVLHDRWGAAGRIFMESLKEHLLEAGYDVICCPCPLFPHHKIEHLFVPELGLGVFTSNDFHAFDLPGAKNIHARRFTQMQPLDAKSARVRFHMKAAKNLLSQADTLMKEAKAWHDQLEKYYVSACDFTEIDSIFETLIAKYF